MTPYIQRAAQFSADEVVSTTDVAGVIGKIGFDFGMLAKSVAVYNDKITAVYLDFTSTAGSTGGFRLPASSNIVLDVMTGGMGLASTTTSTGDKVRVLALGW